MPKPYPQEFRDAGVRPGPGREELAGLRELKRRYRLLEQGSGDQPRPERLTSPRRGSRPRHQSIGGSRIRRGANPGVGSLPSSPT